MALKNDGGLKPATHSDSGNSGGSKQKPTGDNSGWPRGSRGGVGAGERDSQSGAGGTDGKGGQG